MTRPTAERAVIRRKQRSTPLLKAVATFIEAHGGKVLIAGPVQIITWPDDRLGCFTVGIKCVGRRPDKNVLDDE